MNILYWLIPFLTILSDDSASPVQTGVGMMSFSRFHVLFQPSRWALEPDEISFAANGWTNKDMNPVPPHLRTWT